MRRWRWIGLALVASACALDRAGLARDGGGAPADARSDGTVPTDAPSPRPDASCALGPEITLARLDRDAFEDPAATRMRVDVDADHLVLSLEPHRYGVLLARSFAMGPTMIDLDALAALVPDAGAAFVTSTWLDFGANPPGFSSAPAEGHTVHVTGEVYLEAGSTEVEAFFDDQGRLRIGNLEPAALVLDASWPRTAEATVEVPETGWYPIDLAWTDSSVGSSAVIRVRGPSDASREVLGPERLRVRRDASVGREMAGWNDSTISATPDGARLDLDPTDADWRGGRPMYVGIDRDDDFNVRWLGRIELDGANLRCESDDTHRLFVDGVAMGARYGGGGPDEASYPVALRPGTYDVVLEVQEERGNARARLGTGMPLHPFPASAMQPALRFGGFAHAVADGTGRTVDPGGSVDVDLTLASPPGPATAVEVSAIVLCDDPAAIDVQIEHGDQVWEQPLADSARPGGDPVWIYRRTLRAVDGLSESQGGWTITIVNRSETAARQQVVGVLAHHGGRSNPYPTEGVWESAPFELGSDVAFVQQLLVDAQAYFGTSVRVAVRAVPDEAELDGAPWVDVDEVTGTPTATVLGRFAQVRAELRGPGTDTPRLRAIEVRGLPCASAEP